MTKNELIEELSKIEGNPQVFIYEFDVNEYSFQDRELSKIETQKNRLDEIDKITLSTD